MGPGDGEPTVMASTDLTTTDGLAELLRGDARLRLTGAVIAAAVSAPALAVLVVLVPNSGGDEPTFVALLGAAAVVGTVWGPALRPWRLRRALDREHSDDRTERVHVEVLPPATRSFIGALVAVWAARDPAADAPDHVFAADVAAEGMVGDCTHAPSSIAGAGSSHGPLPARRGRSSTSRGPWGARSPSAQG